jgi:phosphoribosylformylglycinamidine synthase subunit PurL
MNPPNYPDVTPKVYREMGVSDAEFAQIVEVLGRTPSYTELGMYAVMWSEHCGYKYSRPVLKAFAEYKKAQESGILENAGGVPLGDTGYSIVFKMESHNHPSAVEPFQGAATGVGGILRDIFTMGARPIAVLDSLRFGPIDGPENARTRHLFEQVVGGISHYGNCTGVGTVGGEIYFHPCYKGNPLVNAMAIGVVKASEIASAQAKGIGNPVLYVGSSTGRDGIHGATFASVELTDESEERRSNVQVGDPFLEKLLIEATLEALQTGHIVGIQDMGAAGLTCGTCEMSAKGGLGMTIDVQLVPRRETGMNAYETMLSESQERMLAVVAKGHEEEVAAVFHKWGLNAAYIGVTTDTGRVVVKDGDRIEADVPAKSLADDCPVYTLKTAVPEYIARVQSADFSTLPEPEDYGDVLVKLLSHPTIASKRWVYEQYDYMVQTQTEIGPGRGDAAVLSVRAAGGARIAATTDCNPRFVYLDPFVGAQIAVAEAARNISCVGAMPAATTDCLNFPSPEKPEGFWQFTEAVNGMAAACEFFKTPVVSGNVSFYNETPEGAIYPTPTVGMVGVFPDGVTPMDIAFKNNGDLIYLLRPVGTDNDEGIAGSEYLSTIHQQDLGKPTLSLQGEASVQSMVREAIAKKYIHSAHDCSEGGLAVSIAESCLAGGKGAEIRVAITDFGTQRWSAILYGEAQSRIVVTVREGSKEQDAFLDLCEASSVEAVFIGQVKDNNRLDAAGMFDVSLDALRDAYEGAIPRAMGEMK